VAIKAVIKRNLYKDSVALMRIAQEVVARTGVRRATLLMGTRGNKDLLAQAGLLDAAVQNAQPSDVMIVIDDEAVDLIAQAVRTAESLIEGEQPRRDGKEPADAPPRSIAMGLALAPNANLAQISVPGPYAGAEALKALRQGLNVFLFSDNMPLEQERAIKELGRRKGLLVMGPDCGTAIIHGVPLGFANVVRRGHIGLVGASGTGLQEVTCRIHQMGAGVSHAIGTGSRDMYEEIGGSTMCHALELLAADRDTNVIVIVSKPPSAAVRQRVLRDAESIGKPVVVCFLGSSDRGIASQGQVHLASTLYDAAAQAVKLVGVRPSLGEDTPLQEAIAGEARKLRAEQKYLRGLFSGGTFCSEAQIIWRQCQITAYSNAPLDREHRLADGAASREHCAIDLGSDEFTVGRPHPMIDHRLRIERLLAEARDPSVAAILLDVVLGYGSHEDPAGTLGPAIREAKAAAARDGRYLPIICFVCGTEDDPQILSVQEEKLRREGVFLAPSSTTAARLAAALVRGVAMESGQTRRPAADLR